MVVRTSRDAGAAGGVALLVIKRQPVGLDQTEMSLRLRVPYDITNNGKARELRGFMVTSGDERYSSPHPRNITWEFAP